MLKKVKGFAVTAVAGLAVLGGTLATFTDSDTANQQILKSGTVAIDVDEDATWSQELDNLAIGETVVRGITLDNASTLAIRSIRLSTTVVDAAGELGGRLSEAVTVTIRQGPHTLVRDLPVSQLAANPANLILDNPATADVEEVLEPGTDIELDFEYRVVGAPASQPGNRDTGARDGSSNPDNKYQGSAFTITYTVDAVQRVARPQ